MSVSQKKFTINNVRRTLGEHWRAKFRENNEFNLGAEVEDPVLDGEGDPIGNEDAEKALRNIVDNEGATPKEREINGMEKLLGTKIEDENFQRHEDFAAEVDTDYHPAQSEIATEVFRNPADMVFRTENLRHMRDRNLLEGQNAYEMAIFEAFATSGENPEANHVPKPRYDSLRGLHGEMFDSMGWIASTQLNKGTPVGDDQTVEEFFHGFFNGGDLPSMLDVAPVVDALFANDPILEEIDEVYELLAEGGRDMVYDHFVSGSPAVLRNNTQRWGDILDEALPTNENYGYIEDLSGIDDHEDYIDMVMDRPMILSPEVDAEQVQVLDPETHEVVGTASEEWGMDSTWVMPGLEDVEESTISFKQFLEDRKYLGEVRVEKDGEAEMMPVKVDHSNLSQKDFEDLATVDREDGSGYFELHNTFVRPDIAPKNNGVVEFRSSSNSPRTYEALLSNMAMMPMHENVQEFLAAYGLKTENSLEFREDAKRNGLDAELPNGKTVEDVHREGFVNILSEGVRQSFSGEELPYTMEMILDDADVYDDFGSYLDSEFDDLRDFAEFTTQLYDDGAVPEPGSYDLDEFESEYEDFVDWFAETYEETMNGYLDEPTEAEKFEERANENSTGEAFEANVRPHYGEA